MTTSKADLVARVPLFAELERADLEEVAAAAVSRSFDAGTTIFHIGEPGRSLFLVAKGTVQIQQPNSEADFELAELGPGDFFGEMALLNDAPRSATALAATPVEALVLDKVDFHRLLRERPEVGARILEAISDRIRSADDVIQRLMDEATRDPLTGVGNRRALVTRLQEESSRARRYGQGFSIVIVDLDDFDAVNDALGREGGDAVLTWIGRLLGEHTRDSDLVYRLEEDAFVVVCPGTGAEGRAAVADRLRALLSEARAPVEGDVTLSVTTGAATFPDDGTDAPGLYRAAQRGLSGHVDLNL